MNDSLIFHTSDIIQNFPNTMNTRWHEGKRVGVAEKTQNDWSDSESCEIWTQKHHLIPVILLFDILPLKIISINVVTSWTKYPYWFISL